MDWLTIRQFLPVITPAGVFFGQNMTIRLLA